MITMITMITESVEKQKEGENMATTGKIQDLFVMERQVGEMSDDALRALLSVASKATTIEQPGRTAKKPVAYGTPWEFVGRTAEAPSPKGAAQAPRMRPRNEYTDTRGGILV